MLLEPDVGDFWALLYSFELQQSAPTQEAAAAKDQVRHSLPSHRQRTVTELRIPDISWYDLRVTFTISSLGAHVLL